MKKGASLLEILELPGIAVAPVGITTLARARIKTKAILKYFIYRPILVATPLLKL
jgi:hypothetical protein